ncbi:MAG: glycosyltransferase [Planctomycetaceae bacterium]|nr:glycosyltransferase [Planctomycetaceae bacterium]
MSNPAVSIVMAAYNAQRSIAATIDSVLAQTHRDFELIVVNDGSADDTAGAVRRANDRRIVLHTNAANIGQTASLNVGLRMARGRYVARIDAGDLSMPRRLERQLAFLAAHPQYAVLGTAAIKIAPDGRRLGVARRPRTMPEVLLRMFYVSPLIHISTMFDRKVALDAGGYDEKFRITADHDLWSRLIVAGHRITSLPAALAAYEINPASLSYAHLDGRVSAEAAQIIRRSARELSGVNLTDEQSCNIFRLFTFGLAAIDAPAVDEAEQNYRSIFARLRGPLAADMTAAAVNRHLMRNYIKQSLQQTLCGNRKAARETLARGRRRYGSNRLALAAWAATCLPKIFLRSLPPLPAKAPTL